MDGGRRARLRPRLLDKDIPPKEMGAGTRDKGGPEGTNSKTGRGEPAVAQVLKRGECTLQDGCVVKAVCIEYTNCGGEYEVSPQQSTNF